MIWGRPNQAEKDRDCVGYIEAAGDVGSGVEQTRKPIKSGRRLLARVLRYFAQQSARLSA